jgi:hypothetical protein
LTWVLFTGDLRDDNQPEMVKEYHLLQYITNKNNAIKVTRNNSISISNFHHRKVDNHHMPRTKKV